MFEYEKAELNNSTVYILRYQPYSLNDYLHILNDSEQERFSGFRSSKRQYEYLSTRILKEHLFSGSTIEYNPQGAPFIRGVPHVSISHTYGCSAIAVSNHHVIGLDIEPLGEKAGRLHSKFLNDHECNILDTANETLMTRAWSCKEALLKLCRRKGIVFKRDLLIEEYDGNETFICTIAKDGKLFSVHLTSKLIDQMIMTINHSGLMQKNGN